ncbi:Uu.00g110420.m01.CDS01 [Anthostomella pinea]|uniref:Uu.00g110420.m01.CDS01 n=1 Tax=Anthostomella pinea TaxID=933095 RepID=A0AAI8VEV3_9PEZI|nr:Uu.00g110420.m01.CDS01 [Anthostomella pinea]
MRISSLATIPSLATATNVENHYSYELYGGSFSLFAQAGYLPGAPELEVSCAASAISADHYIDDATGELRPPTVPCTWEHPQPVESWATIHFNFTAKTYTVKHTFVGASGMNDTAAGTSGYLSSVNNDFDIPVTEFA